MEVDPECPRFLNPIVWSELRATAGRFAERGLRLFLFGSFAAGTQRPGSDLDIGYRSSASMPESLIDELRQAIEALPTIRRVDLVDFAAADPDFVRVAGMHARELP